MIYEWKCGNCGELRTVKRPVKFYNIPPDDKCSCDKYEWTKVITTAPGVPFQQLRDSGVFMDEHGNYPPRKMD
jgi:hypothetical protein